MSFPPANEMFQFAGFASRTYGFSPGCPGSSPGRVAPFGDPGINDRSHLPLAFRSVPRPSSPLSAKASTRCPSLTLDRKTRRLQGQAPPNDKASHEDTLSLEAPAAGHRRKPRLPSLTPSSPCQRTCRPQPANPGSSPDRAHRPRPHKLRPGMVEVNGIEPSTSCLQSRRSPN